MKYGWVVGHARVPRYVRGRQGVVDRDHGVFIFPDTHALDLGKKPQHVYSVRFAARELWGPAAEIRAAQERGDPDLGTTYSLHWLAALEGLVAEKGITTTDELARRKAE